MADSNSSHLGYGEPGDSHRLVCGLCEAVLDEVLPTRSDADLAADEHAEEAHPDHAGVIVLAVNLDTVVKWPQAILEIAVRAQRGIRVNVDERPREGGDDES